MYIIDRFEGEWAVAEDDKGQTFNLPRELCPEAKEGDVIHISVTIDSVTTKKRRKSAEKMLEHFFDE